VASLSRDGPHLLQINHWSLVRDKMLVDDDSSGWARSSVPIGSIDLACHRSRTMTTMTDDEPPFRWPKDNEGARVLQQRRPPGIDIESPATVREIAGSPIQAIRRPSRASPRVNLPRTRNYPSTRRENADNVYENRGMSETSFILLFFYSLDSWWNDGEQFRLSFSTIVSPQASELNL